MQAEPPDERGCDPRAAVGLQWRGRARKSGAQGLSPGLLRPPTGAQPRGRPAAARPLARRAPRLDSAPARPGLVPSPGSRPRVAARSPLGVLPAPSRSPPPQPLSAPGSSRPPSPSLFLPIPRWRPGGSAPAPSARRAGGGVAPSRSPAPLHPAAGWEAGRRRAPVRTRAPRHADPGSRLVEGEGPGRRLTTGGGKGCGACAQAELVARGSLEGVR